METFQQRLARLIAGDEPLNRSGLKLLANLGPQHSRVLTEYWLGFDREQRRMVLHLALELAEEQVDLDFRPVFQIGLSDPDADLRALAVSGLWEDERPVLQQQLQRMLNDEAGNVREAAALGLARFARRAALGELDSAAAARLLQVLLQHVGDAAQPLEVRRRCIEALGYFDTSDDAMQLVRQAYRDDEITMRESALLAMGRSMRDEFLPDIRRELQSPAPALRYEAARAVGELGEDGRSLLPTLLPLVDDDDTDIAFAAIWALGQVGGDSARRVLSRLARSNNEARAQAAQDALAELDLDNF